MYTGTLVATSNRVKWSYSAFISNPETNAAIDLTGATIRIGLRVPGQSACLLTGTNSDGHIAITAGTGGGFNVTFSKAEMQRLCASEYEVGLVIVLADGTEHQVLAAQLPVVDGVVDKS